MPSRRAPPIGDEVDLRIIVGAVDGTPSRGGESSMAASAYDIFDVVIRAEKEEEDRSTPPEGSVREMERSVRLLDLLLLLLLLLPLLLRPLRDSARCSDRGGGMYGIVGTSSSVVAFGGAEY